MYSVSEFKELMVSRLPDFFPKDWKDAQVEVIPDAKRGNETLTGISVRFDGDKGKQISCSPVVYLEYAFEKYQRELELGRGDDCALDIIENMAYSLADGVRMASTAGSRVSVANGLPPILTEDWEKHATVRAVPLALVEGLHTTPLKVVGDIAFIPCIRAIDNEEHCELWCVMQDVVFEHAGLPYDRNEFVQAIDRNRHLLSEVDCVPMIQIVARMMHCDEDTVKAMSGGGSDVPDIYVLSYKNDGKHGAGLLFDDGLLTQVMDKYPVLKDGFFVLPSSIHETILIPLGQGDPEHFAEMQENIQNTVLRPEERLSDSIYCYTRDAGLVPAHVLFNNLGM